MKIVFYNETLLSGGIEKCIEGLIEYLYPKYEIEIVYVDDKKLDNNIVHTLKKKAYVHKLKSKEIIRADICIWCRLYMDYNTLKKQIIAKKNILWIHSKPREKENCIIDNKDFLRNLNDIICVSNTVKKELNIDNKSIVIHNFLPHNIKKMSEEKIEDNIFIDSEKIKFITVSRLSKGKGFERVLKLVNTLQNYKVNFEYIVVGKGRAEEEKIKNMFKNIEQVKFIGYKENPYPYIKKADYLVQLSDYETWGNVITEAKYLHIPVIVTNFDSAYEQVEDEKNGIIINLEEKEYDIYVDKIINNKQKYKKNLQEFQYKNEIDKWLEVLQVE